jgi:hypothetical protein
MTKLNTNNSKKRYTFGGSANKLSLYKLGTGSWFKVAKPHIKHRKGFRKKELKETTRENYGLRLGSRGGTGDEKLKGQLHNNPKQSDHG